jgi:hypothetical protein
LAAVAGHTHRNAIRRGPGGVWLIETASLADFPQQSRFFRVVRTTGGRIAIETFMVDHGAGAGGLAATSLELGYLDAQGGRPNGFAGARRDRNALRYLDKRPFNPGA